MFYVGYKTDPIFKRYNAGEQTDHDKASLILANRSLLCHVRDAHLGFFHHLMD